MLLLFFRYVATTMMLCSRATWRTNKRANSHFAWHGCWLLRLIASHQLLMLLWAAWVSKQASKQASNNDTKHIACNFLLTILILYHKSTQCMEDKQYLAGCITSMYHAARSLGLKHTISNIATYHVLLSTSLCPATLLAERLLKTSLF